MAKEISFAVRDRLFRMAKRSTLPWHRAWLIRLIAVSCSLIVCALIIVAITKQNPIDIYLGIIDGAVGKSRRIWATVRETLVLLIIAIGLTPAFKMRFWNIGAEGQLLMGGAAGAAVMIYLTGIVPGWMVLILVFVASILAGMLWGLLPAVFKAYFHTNETLFTLMMNYVAIQIVTVCIVFWENPPGSNFVGVINSDSEIGWLPKLFGLSYGWNLILVLSVTIGMFIYMKYSKQGYEIAVVGESSHTARYAGINIKKVIIRTMLISGGICGFAGAIIVSGASHTISTTIGNGRGFTAIIVAWMAKFNPIVMILVSFFLVFMQQGSIQIATQFGLNENASNIITGIILFFLIGSEFFINYKLEFRKQAKEVQG